MADDNIFLNSDPVIDEKLYPREADGILRTSIEEFDLQNWNDPPVCEECGKCTCGNCRCSCTECEQEDWPENETPEETEFVDP